MTKLLSTTAFLLALAGVTTSALAQDAKAGDAKAGEKKAAMCIGCHGIDGYQASFPEVYKVPRIAGQNAKYIASALNAYAKGDRKHPTMRGIAVSLTEQDIADLAAFYEGLPKDLAPVPAKPEHEPSAEVAALLKRANCVSCHGDNFNKPIDGSYPKLAGQHADYLFAALRSYQVDAKNPQVGRSNAIMAGMAKQYTHAELKQIANYLATLPGDVRTVHQSPFR